MHEQNCFITLTYSDENLKSPKLQYRDFQLFVKRLRKSIHNQQIGIFVTGEYGEQTKRPHWHAIIFGWEPPDLKYKRSNERGDRILSSKTLDSLWSHGTTETGTVTFESAGYCARYAAKKLVHGKDEEHEFKPISKKSSKQAIGKAWIEKHWKYVFQQGKINIQKSDGEIVSCSIPRYYEKWLLKNEPTAWRSYVTQKKAENILKATNKNEKEKTKEKEVNEKRTGMKGPQITRNKARAKILKQKFEQLQKHLKL
jgi:hypothetical protein